MHQPTTTPRPSIFFDYTVYPFEPPPELRGERVRHTVAVVGAGPIGLALALDLARQGVRCVLLTAEQQVSEGSRALAYARRSMEILQQVGAADAIQALGLPWRYGTSFYRGEPVFRMDMPHDDDERFAPMTNLQQQHLERILVERIAAQPAVALRWGNRVTGVARNDDGVVLQVDTPAGPYRLEADWVVAADGARSELRQCLGLRMDGASYEGRFVIADIRVELPFPTERRAYFDPDWNRGNTVLMHREPFGLWRIDYQLPAGESPEQALQPASLHARIDAQLAMVGATGARWELDWCSVYSARALTLADYVHGRILFAGDAAHMLPIFGVRGANTGWQDGQGLAWRLALVARGLAPAALLASYSRERVGAAREIIGEASRSVRFMTPPTAGYRALRDAALSLAVEHDFVRPLLHWRTSRPHEYLDSPLNTLTPDEAQFAGGPRPGAVLRNARLREGEYLLDHVGTGFTVIDFGEGAQLGAPMRDDVAAARAQGLTVTVLAVRRTADTAVTGADRTLADPDGRAFSRCDARAAPAVYLVRPDQHVCARWRAPQPGALERAIRRALGH